MLKIISLFMCLLSFSVLSRPIQAYYAWHYESSKLYYYDNQLYQDTSGSGYALVFGILGLYYPPIVGLLSVVGGVGAISDGYEIPGAFFTGVGAGMVMSAGTQGSVFPLIFGASMFAMPVLAVVESRGDSGVDFVSDALIRRDIGLDYEAAMRIRKELIKEGYLTGWVKSEVSPAVMDAPVLLSGDLERFSAHTTWVLRAVRECQVSGSSSVVVFHAPDR